MLSFNMKMLLGKIHFHMYMHGIPCYPEWCLGIVMKRKHYAILYVDAILIIFIIIWQKIYNWCDYIYTISNKHSVVQTKLIPAKTDG